MAIPFAPRVGLVFWVSEADEPLPGTVPDPDGPGVPGVPFFDPAEPVPVPEVPVPVPVVPVPDPDDPDPDPDDPLPLPCARARPGDDNASASASLVTFLVTVPIFMMRSSSFLESPINLFIDRC